MGAEPALNKERVSAWMPAPSTISDSGEAMKGLRRLPPPPLMSEAWICGHSSFCPSTPSQLRSPGLLRQSK